VSERAQQALNLRKAGATYEQIAERVGYANRGTAHRAVRRALRDAQQDTQADLRSLDAERLDQLLMALWGKALAGSGEAADRVLRIIALREGIEAPKPAGPARRLVVDAVTEELAALPERLQLGALAASALELARSIDSGVNQATCTKELRAVLADLQVRASDRRPVEAQRGISDLTVRIAERRRQTPS
jgi:hypothetical protein